MGATATLAKPADLEERTTSKGDSGKMKNLAELTRVAELGMKLEQALEDIRNGSPPSSRSPLTWPVTLSEIAKYRPIFEPIITQFIEKHNPNAPLHGLDYFFRTEIPENKYD